MRKYITLILLLFSFWVNAQNNSFVDLGYLNGDFRIKSFQIERSKESHGELMLVSNSDYLSIKRDRNNSDSLMNWSVELSLDKRIGLFSDSLVFTTEDELIVETIVVDYQILKGSENVFKSYDNEFWPFRSKEQVFNLRAARRGKELHGIFDLYNFSGHELDLQDVSMSDSIKIQFEPSIVPHHTFTRARIQYQSSDTASLGFNRTAVPILNHGDTLAFIPIQYSLLPASAIAAPNVEVNRKNFDFKVVKQGDKKTEVTFLSNNGSKPIQILSIESNCECLTYELSENVIAPGENIQLRVNFDSTDRLGLEQKTVSVFLDSDTQPVINFMFKAHVKK